jgi:hypothetical protein
MYRTVHIEHYGKLVLIQVIRKQIVMCAIVQKKYVLLMFLTAYRAAGLRVNMLKENIEMDMKKWPA